MMKTDWRPKDFREQIAKYRKVLPPELSINSSSGRQSSASGTRSVISGIETYTGTWGTAQILHLLRRCLFGVTKSELRQFENLNMQEAVELLLKAEEFPAPPVNDYSGIDDIPDDPDVPRGESWVKAKRSDDFEGPRIISLKSWILSGFKNQSPSIHQKLMLCWHNLLATQSWEIFHGRASYQYFRMLHQHAFGNYKTLIRSLTLDPAMLFFLNGTFNHKDAPDENYARELQELFTVGKGPGSQYTEDDVLATARVLTGWVVDWEGLDQEGEMGSGFDSSWHDEQDKQFSDFYGNTVIQGRGGEDGAEELDELLTMIFDTNEAALYICRRLYRHFVYAEIDETVEQNVIKPLANQLRDSGYEIKPVLTTLLTSEHFYDVANQGAMIKSPIDFLIGSLKTLDLNSPDESLNINLKFHESMLWQMGAWGQEMCDPPSVAGWPAYYQEPQYDKSWITTDTIVKRAQVMDGGIYWGFWIIEDLHPRFDLLSFVEQLDHPEDPDLLLAELMELFIPIQPAVENLAELRYVLLNGRSEGIYWTGAWNDYKADPSDENKGTVLNRLNPTFQVLFQMGEFQLM
ncbi:MAG: DUF1800 domain-containing protein [Cyclobacteriaceae bacterium]